ncbi:MAG TPA: hypothetical protein PLK10_14230, partial [Ottowia sp.]|nr:hypothetical protein [Ottowia sp.]
LRGAGKGNTQRSGKRDARRQQSNGQHDLKNEGRPRSAVDTPAPRVRCTPALGKSVNDTPAIELL